MHSSLILKYNYFLNWNFELKKKLISVYFLYEKYDFFRDGMTLRYGENLNQGVDTPESWEGLSLYITQLICAKERVWAVLKYIACSCTSSWPKKVDEEYSNSLSNAVPWAENITV